PDALTAGRRRCIGGGSGSLRDERLRPCLGAGGVHGPLLRANPPAPPRRRHAVRPPPIQPGRCRDPSRASHGRLQGIAVSAKPPEFDSGNATGGLVGQMGALLLPHHERLLTASAISPEVAAARGYRSVERTAELKGLGFAGSQC